MLIELAVGEFVAVIGPSEDCEDGVQMVKFCNVILRDKASGGAIPMNIDYWTSRQMARAFDELNGKTENSPGVKSSHGFFLELLAFLDAFVKKVVITKLDGERFCSDLYLENLKGEIKKIDAPVTEAIILAMRAGAPIYIEEDLFVYCMNNEAGKERMEYIEELVEEYDRRQEEGQ